MLRLGAERDSVRVVDDQVGQPTYTGHLAEALIQIADSDEYGIHHRSAGGQCSWYELARFVFETAEVDCEIEPCTTAEFPRPAHASGLLRARERARGGEPARLAARRRRVPRRPRGARMKLLVTGAAGFIGSTYVRLIQDEHDVVVLDKLTYAGRRENLPDGVELVVGSIEDRALVTELAEGVDAIVNFAAESHVDRSIADQDVFARTHVIGTSVLLDAARERGVGRYLQVSTDEVYGSIPEGSFTETSPLDPSSPYSATKAGGDLLVSAHAHTYGIEAVICRGSNNYGPRQYPEKLIPLCILNALHDDPLPVYGDGRQIRNWLYVEDFARGIQTVLERGRSGEAYNVGGPDECENIEVVRRILELTGRDESLIEYVKDRPGPRPALLAQLRQAEGRARLGGAGPLRGRSRPHGRLVPRQRGLVGADPLGRVPRLLRAALRQSARLEARAEHADTEAAAGRRDGQRPTRAALPTADATAIDPAIGQREPVPGRTRVEDQLERGAGPGAPADARGYDPHRVRAEPRQAHQDTVAAAIEASPTREAQRPDVRRQLQLEAHVAGDGSRNPSRAEANPQPLARAGDVHPVVDGADDLERAVRTARAGGPPHRLQRRAFELDHVYALGVIEHVHDLTGRIGRRDRALPRPSRCR